MGLPYLTYLGEKHVSSFGTTINNNKLYSLNFANNSKALAGNKH